MNNYYSLKILVTECKELIENFSFCSAISRKKSILEIFFQNDEKVLKLWVDFSSVQPVMFVDDRSEDYDQAKGIAFFEELIGEKVHEVKMATNDRVVWLEFLTGRIQLTLFGPRANAVFVPSNEELSTQFFKSRPTEIISPSSDVNADAALFDHERLSKASSIKQKLLVIDPKLPREFFKELDVQNGLSRMNDNDLISFVDELMTQMTTHPEPFITSDYRVGVIARQFLPKDFGSFANALMPLIRQSYFVGASARKFAQQMAHYETVFAKEIARLRKMVDQIGDEAKIRDRILKNRQHADVVMANLHQDKGEGNYQFLNFYDESSPVEIQLERGKTLKEYAQKLYNKCRHLEESIGENLSKKKEIAGNLETLESASLELSEVLDAKALRIWIKSWGHLVSKSKDQSVTTESLPFRVTSFHGFDIWVGRNATSNDELLRLSHKEDVWMHARGTGGSHLIIRMNKNREWPNQDVLEKVASLAAYNSKMRGSSVVAVQMAKRKFVRKVKGGAPGMVLVDKEVVIDVTPTKNLS